MTTDQRGPWIVRSAKGFSGLAEQLKLHTIEVLSLDDLVEVGRARRAPILRYESAGPPAVEWDVVVDLTNRLMYSIHTIGPGAGTAAPPEVTGPTAAAIPGPETYSWPWGLTPSRAGAIRERARRIRELDDQPGVSDEEVVRLLREIPSLAGDCNLIPSELEADCKRTLVVVPELVSIALRRGLWKERMPNYPQLSREDPEEGPCGICSGLCMAARHVRRCYQPSSDWNNRVVIVLGSRRQIRLARCQRLQCEELDTQGPVDTAIIPHAVFYPRRLEEGFCWERFVASMQRQRGQPGAPSGFPLLYLNTVPLFPL